jgi:serine protease inhibitor
MYRSQGAASLPARVGAVLLVAAVLLAGCGASTPPGDAARIDAKLVANLDPGDARAVGQAVNAFGFDLFVELANGQQNTITSPLSVAVLLAMVLAGADGDTAMEMAKVLHLDDRRDVRVGALLRTLADTEQVTLSVVVFRVDGPFAFTISDQQTGTILFLGAVTDPRT